MARATDRRPGFSRRAQVGIFTGYVVAILGVVIGAGLLIASLVQPALFSGARSAAAEVARPVGQAAATGRRSGIDVLGAIRAYFNAGRQNAALHHEVDLARADAVKRQSLEQENRRLKALLGIREQEPHVVTAARLIGSTASSLRRFAVIAAGSRSGVMIGQPVRSAAGLIGRVLEVGPDTARVLLVTDPENVVPVRRASDGVPAFVQGAANGRVAIRLINSGVATLHKGDLFVTSGSGGMFAPGIPVAVVTEPNRDGATGMLTGDPADADYVTVEQSYQPEAVAALAVPIAPPQLVPPPKKKKKIKAGSGAAATPAAVKAAPAAPVPAAGP
ncbi:rod shape-determining protein MreC [Novosphingobium sp.]|uniref:rod shape-determining protein MreC n=1 Tax=Novosphingobium sp. TaxID=1874826 RepID=UPI0025E84754|nr:rod shape-determining protein MreC [Novosphingobium sp.]